MTHSRGPSMSQQNIMHILPESLRFLELLFTAIPSIFFDRYLLSETIVNMLLNHTSILAHDHVTGSLALTRRRLL